MPGHRIPDQQAHLFMVQRRHHTQAVAAAKDQAVDMRMMRERLPPYVDDPLLQGFSWALI